MHNDSIIAEPNRNPPRIDFTFLMIVIVLSGLGITALYSGSFSYAQRVFDDPSYFVRRQLINLAVGIFLFIVSASISLDMLRKQLPKIIVVTIVLLILPLIPGIGVSKNGASRWINLGINTFQPSELAKIVIVFFLANLFSKKHDRLNEPEVSIYPAAIMSFIMVAIVYLQNDFSTALFIVAIVLSMFYIAGVKISWFVLLCVLTTPFLLLMVLTREYRVERILSFFQPQRDPLGSSYQVNASLLALREGGFWGRGIGNGIRKISSIPEVQSDFIFAVWGEEMGFLGVLLYFTILVFFAYRGFKISLSCADRFRSYFAFGCTLIVVLQSLINCGVVVKFFPATGIPLPFFSSGGSSLLITLSLCGIILNISRCNKQGEMYNV